jgi:NADPH:quinone reductase
LRAVEVREHGGPEVLAVRDVDEPEPAAGQVRVRVATSGVNFIDVYFRTGAYPSGLPFVLGVEAAGTVDAVGPDVEGVGVGDRVAFAGQPGSHAEAVCVPADRTVPVPEDVDFDTAAAAMLQGLTAHYLATSTFPVEPGQHVLVHAAAGGVGHLLTQVCKRRGATVFATVGSEDKARIVADLGADEVIRYDEEDFAEAIVERAGVRMDVVFDSVGKVTFERSLDCLRPRGMLVLCGQSSGAVAPLDPQALAQHGSLYLTRPTIVHYTATRDDLLARAGELFGWIGDGSLAVRIGESHPLEDAAEAYRRLEGRATTGKVLLHP